MIDARVVDARGDVRRGQPWLAGTAPSAQAADLHAAAAGRRRADRTRGGREQLVASRRPHQPGAVVLPRLRAGPQRISSSPAGPTPSSPRWRRDARPGRDPARAGRRRHRGDRHPAAGGGHPAGAGRAVAAGRRGHPRRHGHRLRRHPPRLRPGRPARRTGRPAPLGPRHASRCRPTPLHPTRWTAPQARRRPHLLQAGLLADHPTRPPRATPPATAGPKPSPGTGCTPACRPAAPGSTITANSP